MLKLFFRDIDNQYTLDNFRRIEGEINGQIILSASWRPIELTFTAAKSNFRYEHNMKFVPTDVIQTRLTGAGAVTYNYTLFDETHIDISTSGACVVKFLLGRYDVSV